MKYHNLNKPNKDNANLQYEICKKFVALLRKSESYDNPYNIEELKTMITEPLIYLDRLCMIKRLTGDLDDQVVLKALKDSGLVVEGSKCNINPSSAIPAALSWGQLQLDY